MKILIAGASGGIGIILTKHFDLDNNTLILTYNQSPNKVYKPKNAQSQIIRCDFTDKNNVQKLFSQINSLDVLINVMGHVENVLVKRMNEEEWDRVINSNVKTVFLSCRYAIESLNNNGHIINFSSVLGSTGMIGATNYVSAKGAVESFTKSLALECLHGNRIFVNAIALGYFNIGMGLDLNDKIASHVKNKIPIKEFGDPTEICYLVDYIIKSKYLVGQIIHLNGGLNI